MNPVSDRSPGYRTNSSIHVVALVALMVVHALLALDALTKKSPTVDEVGHLAAGISYLEKSSFRVYPHNPPLVRMLTALAARTTGLEVAYDGAWNRPDPVDHWGFAFECLFNAWQTEPGRQQYLTAVTRARIVVAIWSVLTIPILFLWARWWFGTWSAYFAAALWAFLPEAIAHAGMITTDLPAASMMVVSCYSFARWLDRPTFVRAALAGLLLGLALLTKFTLLNLLVLWPIWWMIHLIALGRPRVPLFAGHALVALLVAVLTLDAGYFWEGVGTSIGDYPFVSATLTRDRQPGDKVIERESAVPNLAFRQRLQFRVNRFRSTLLESLPCPLPFHYLAGFDQQKFEAEGKYQAYLLGTWSRTGWSWYYPFALLIKYPLGLWGLCILSFLAVVVRRSGERLAAADNLHFLLTLVLGVLPLAVMAIGTDINIGVRYVLPIAPFLVMVAAGGVRDQSQRWLRLPAAGLLLWVVAATLWIHPHELSYFNESIGGPANGRFFLADSNIDWGQDLRGLARWLEKNPAWRNAGLAYWGNAPPEFEGIANYSLAPRGPAVAEPLRPEERARAYYGPQPGRFIVSVNFERGMDFRMPCPFDRLAEFRAEAPDCLIPRGPAAMMLRNPAGAFAYFQRFTPRIVPEVGYSLLFFEISREQANLVRQELGLPTIGETP